MTVSPTARSVAVPSPGGVRARPQSATTDRRTTIGRGDTRVYNESTRDQRRRPGSGRPSSAASCLGSGSRPGSASSGRSSPTGRVSPLTTEHRLPTVGEGAPPLMYKQAPAPTSSPAEIHRSMHAKLTGVAPRTQHY